MNTHGGISPPQQLCTTLRRCIEPSWSPTESNCCTTISSISKQGFRTCSAFSATKRIEKQTERSICEKKANTIQSAFYIAQGERIKPCAMVRVTRLERAKSPNPKFGAIPASPHPVICRSFPAVSSQGTNGGSECLRKVRQPLWPLP